MESAPGQGARFHFTLPLLVPASRRGDSVKSGEVPAAEVG